MDISPQTLQIAIASVKAEIRSIEKNPNSFLREVGISTRVPRLREALTELELASL